MRFRHGDDVQVWRQSPPDRYGDRQFAYSHTLTGVGIEYPSTSENDENRQQVVADAVVFAKVGDDVTSTDRIVFPDGGKYAVIGKPFPRKSPFSGWTPGLVIRARAVEG